MNPPAPSFEEEIERIFDVVINTIDAADTDCDCEQTDATLTLRWPDGRTVVLSRNAAHQELWVAAREGGFHFCRDGSGWVDTRSGEALAETLSRVCEEPVGRRLTFRL